MSIFMLPRVQKSGWSKKCCARSAREFAPHQWRPYRSGRSGGARGPTDLGGPTNASCKKLWSITIYWTKRSTEAANTEMMNKLYIYIIIKLVLIYSNYLFYNGVTCGTLPSQISHRLIQCNFTGFALFEDVETSHGCYCRKELFIAETI